jgi:UDP-N-acetylglucosamine 4,6-dehydratase
MTRFWMRLDAAVELVKFALLNMSGGEVYVPKLMSVRMTDLAEVMAPGRWDVGTIREGEKLYESMINEDEGDGITDVGPYFAIGGKSGEKTPGRFSFRSDHNGFLTQDEIRKELELV